MEGVNVLDHNKTLINFESMDIDKTIVVNTEKKSTVKIDQTRFAENFVSRIEFVKHKFSDGYNLLIIAYTGHMTVATVAVHDDYVVEIDKDETNIFSYVYVRKACNYDYTK